MMKQAVNSVSREKILYAILSGVMLTASFPPGRMDWVAWIALAPLLKSIEEASCSNAFRLGLVAGLAHYLTNIYWVVVVLGRYGGLNFFFSFSALLLLCLYLSLFTGLFAFLVRYAGGTRLRPLMTAFLWVALEYARAHLLTGFPWCLLGYSQFRNLNMIQIANLFGVYGLSFLLAFSSASIYALFFDRAARKAKRRFAWEGLLVLPMAILTLIYGDYVRSVHREKEKDQRSIRVAVVQGNIDQSIKWDPAYQDKTIDVYRRLTQTSLRFKPDLIVWPETSVPFFFQEDTALARKVHEITKGSGAYLLFGSPAYGRRAGVIRYYNRAYLLSPEGEVRGFYDKIHLVPFGEYVPLKGLLFFLNRLVPAAGDFASGDKIVALRLPSLSAGVLICFEAIFPELARAHVKNHAKILVNLTNDAWFGETSAPYQHLSMSVFRAVENGRPLVRAANTGFSAYISPVGKISSRGDLFREETLPGEIRLDGAPLTFYTLHGDLFAVIISVICLIKIFLILCYDHSKRTT